MDSAAIVQGPLTDPATLEAQCRSRLESFRGRLRDEPRYNPVAQLSFELSRDMEAGKLAHEDLINLARRLGQESFEARAEGLGAYVGPVALKDNVDRLRAAIEKLIGSGGSFEDDLALLERARIGIVFTAHPTFLLKRSQRQALARKASGHDVATPSDPLGPDSPMTLQIEHAATLDALDAAKAALVTFTRVAVAVMKERHPDDWKQTNVGFSGLGTWIGYDLDGRTDIRWSDTFRFRLAEKVHQISRYETVLERICDKFPGAAEENSRIGQLSLRLKRLRAWSAWVHEAFSQEPLDKGSLDTAADLLTSDHPHKEVSVDALVAMLNEAIEEAPDDLAIELITLRSEMKSLGFGVGEVHMRINATQLHNAIMQHLDMESEEQIGSRSMMDRLAGLIRDAEPLKVNFGSLDIEQKTALRMFIIAAQILKHVDRDCSIRMLIAECELPATALTAFYFSKLFGVDHKIDVSPLFETPAALESASRFFEALASTPEYCEMVRKRGRIAIQTGFSDSGRFMGQIPAALAIERLHGQLARTCERHGLTDVEVLIFDTHGESAGRGAHQRSFVDRSLYVFSPWARMQFETLGIKVKHEVTFQGGDGFVYFETPELALATVSRLIEAEADWRDLAGEDALYSRTNFSLDFYRRVANFHDHLLDDRAYHVTLGSFAPGLLNETGSRKSRRQFDVSASDVHQVRKFRAIPHNAILQQLGHPLTVIAGFGTAMRGDEDRFVDVYATSDRLRRLTSHVSEMKKRSSIKALAAFAVLYDPVFWSTRPYAGAEPHLAEPCLFITQLLEEDDRAASISAMAVKLRLDAIWLHRVLDRCGLNPGSEVSEKRQRLDMLHAVRLALLQHIFLMAARVPRFSTRNDISRDDIMQLIFALRIPEAVALLHDAYPADGADMSGYKLRESYTYPGEAPANYESLSARLIDPITECHAAILEIGAAIALEFGAHG
ncbi:Phosphoenolpyruvate carboxylase [Hartmannibacter diazotrophicus]|uniref:Phosphoenolpyruvate carboxylase n=1 Tax=Hartmannibacter diazotrophicus TaxID=1482074 RepID=A0A2C9DBK8_9HYPH|nr:phosphoenolpyruvate carboxylase [Hartmannibacter diazotrophicus]SON57687.1 Phosphoenolpyruvate carboxylase [Hartmannibacter diazotrophicus]